MEVHVIPRLKGGGKKWQHKGKARRQSTGKKNRCKMITKRGWQCTIPARHNGLCYRHLELGSHIGWHATSDRKSEEEEPEDLEEYIKPLRTKKSRFYRCVGTTRKGTRCESKTK